MTRPTDTQLHETLRADRLRYEEPVRDDGATYPKDWAQVTGYAQKNWGFSAMVILLLSAAVVVEFWYLQEQNKRASDLAEKLIVVLTQNAVSYEKFTNMFQENRKDLVTHQKWEEDMIREAMPYIHKLKSGTN